MSLNEQIFINKKHQNEIETLSQILASHGYQTINGAFNGDYFDQIKKVVEENERLKAEIR